MIGCSPTSQILESDSAGKAVATEYSAIYYIHADGDYLFHQSDGSPVQANEAALDQAREVAKNARSGEIFIFHQKAQTKRFGLFSRNQSEFYHYRNGRLLNRVNYRYTDGYESLLTTESNFYHAYRSRLNAPGHQAYFFFFGHEIPRDHKRSYHRSQPRVAVTPATFASGLKKFLNEDQNFDLVVLSTCNNATTSMAKNLFPFTDYLLASPQNLHLSYIDIDAMRLLEDTQVPPVYDVAFEMATNTYNRLSRELHTAVTLTVFDLVKVADYIEAFDNRISAFEETTNPDPYRDNIDCAELPFFISNIYSKGVTSFYRPAKFGMKAGSDIHSGWGCRGL